MNVLEQLKSGFVSHSAEETMAFAEALVDSIPQDHTLALCGEVGAGKTTFVKGLARGWGIKQPVTSPSFNIFLTYKGTVNLLHLDGYRITQEEDLEELMLEEFLEPPYCLVMEWPEHVPDLVPKDAWQIDFTIEVDGTYRISRTRPQS